MKINKKIVESYLGKKVEIKLFDGTVLIGYLQKPINLMFNNKWYHTINPDSNIMFRSSHVRSITEVSYESIK